MRTIEKLEAIIEKKDKDIISLLEICTFYVKECQRLKDLCYEKAWEEVENDIKSK